MKRDNCGLRIDDCGWKRGLVASPPCCHPGPRSGAAIDNPKSRHVCSIHRELEIVPGDMNDYGSLAAHHYRDNRPAVVKAVYTIRPKRSLGSLGRRPAGVIVYAMATPRVELRTLATGGAFSGLDRQTELEMLNRHVRCIARVIVEPRFRGVGLAVRLVRETMPRLDVPIIEALGVMPLVNPFLERAGLKSFAPRVPVEHVALVEALSVVGIEEAELIDPESVQQKLDRLAQSADDFIEVRMRQFLKSHGSRRTMPGGLERTRYILGKLTHRPAYYLWINPLRIGDCGVAPSVPSNPQSTIRNPQERILWRSDDKYKDQPHPAGQTRAAPGQCEPHEPGEFREAGPEHRADRPV